MTLTTCPLCNSNSTVFCEKPKHLFYKCNVCEGIFRPAFTYLTPEDEKAHYELHNNDVNDVRYQNFVSPIVNAILQDFTPNDKGLDFGSGTGPVVSKMLRDQGFQMENYDLYFENKPELLTRKYDYISCCEVMEHFKQPLQEFQLLHSILLSNGKLYCKTEVFKNQKPFEDWYYKDDFTHVFIYQETTLHWIQKNLPFQKVLVYDKLIVFEK